MQYGLVVDGLHDSEEIVVKPLGRHMQDCRCLAGATILGDGQVALILDVVGIASHTQLVLPDEDDVRGKTDSAVRCRQRNPTPFACLPTIRSEQFGIPMGAITRLERIRRDQIDSVGGQEVLQYRGGSLPLLTLEKYIKAAPRPDTEKVLCCRVQRIGPGSRPDGSRVDRHSRTADYRGYGNALRTGSDRLAGGRQKNYPAVGPLRVDQAGPSRLVRRQQADMRDQAPVKARKKRQPSCWPRIPLSFSNKWPDSWKTRDTKWSNARMEQSPGIRSTIRAVNFDLVVTDLEMPNMNGFELSRKIKDDPEFSHLPIIALTSLASEEDVQRGMEAGIDDYQIKLDRERLLASISNYLQTNNQNTKSCTQYAEAVMGR